jgi:hypothetical protein
VIFDKKLKKTLSSHQKKTLSNNFINFYSKKNWKIGKHKIQITNWQHALIEAANNWKIYETPTKNETSDILNEVFNDN